MSNSSLVLGPDDRKCGEIATLPTRRSFLSTALVGAVSTGAFGSFAASALADKIHRFARRMFDPTDLDRSIVQLIGRTTFGFTPSLYDEVVAMGFEEFVESQLNYQAIDDSIVEARLTPYFTLSMTSEEIYDAYNMERDVPIRHLVEATILRAVLSKRQLYERMVEFWTDHFSVNINDQLVPFFKTADDRDVIREHAMTTFPQLLNANARSAAMLYYLDNYANIVGHAQENYARELMELHTLSVDGPYTQQDVEEVARCLTGWTIAGEGNPLGFGAFVFHPPFHDDEAKTVLGQFIPAGGGESDGQTVLDILAYHPKTAEFIAGKLCKRFCAYEPPQQLIDSVTDTYLATGGDIKSMLRVILQEDVLQSFASPKFKRPFHLVASLLRASNASISDPRLLLEMLFIMGHAPFFWATPDGYPDRLDAWSTSLLPRWQFASYIFDGVFPGVFVNVSGVIGSEGLEPGNEIAAINLAFGQPLSNVETQMLESFLSQVPPGYPGKLSDALGLATTLPGFQWY